MISSRTPEGDPNRCPICGHYCRLEPSWPGRDGPCPYCGHLLWFRKGDSSEDLLAVVLMLIEAKFGPPSYEVKSAVMALVERTDERQVLVRAATASTLTELLADEA